MARNAIGSTYRRARGGFARIEKVAKRVHNKRDTTLSVQRVDARLQKKV